jgi:hypothetical protein
VTTDADARAYLDYYLDRKGDPEFAVMLEGPWGSGKSHFFDQYFKARHAAAVAKDPKVKEDIRVSLFGVSDLNEISSLIFAKAHPWLSGTTARVANTLVSKAISYFGVATKPEENQKLLQQMMASLDGRVLVFDDLERCPLPVVEVMGFINRFVEQDKLKVIVVASEDDIPVAQLEDYKARKEKLIGKTIRVGSEPGVVLDAFSAELAMPEAKAAIVANRDAVLTIFTARDKPNFRSLRSILFDFDRVIELADVKLRGSADALGAVLRYMVAIGMEYRSSTIDAEGLRTLTSDVALRLNFNNAPISDGRVRGRELRELYPLVSWGDPIVPPEMLADLFASGTFDVPALDVHLLKHPLVVGPAAVPAWRVMWSWYDLGATDYTAVRAMIVDQLAHRKIVHPGELLHVAGTSLRLLDLDDDLLGGGGKPKVFFKAYLDDLEKTGALLSVPELFGIHAGSHAGLIYNEHETKAFAEIHGLVSAASVRALQRKMKAESSDLLKRLQAEPNDGSPLHEWGLAEGNYGGVAILHDIAVGDMADLLLVDSRFNDVLMAALSRRYERTRGDNALDSEKPWVRQLHTELKDRLKATAAPYRAWGGGRLGYYFDAIETWAKPKRRPKALPKQP